MMELRSTNALVRHFGDLPRQLPQSNLAAVIDCPITHLFLFTLQRIGNGQPAVGSMCNASFCKQYEAECATECPDSTGANFSDTEDNIYDFCRYTPEQQPTLRWLHTRYSRMWHAYTHLLANNRSMLLEGGPQQVPVKAGSQVRLRMINGAASVCFWMQIPDDLRSEVYAVDGVNVKRGVYESSIPLCPGQRADVIINIPTTPAKAYPILAQWAGELNQTSMILTTTDITKADMPSPTIPVRAPLTSFDFEKKLSAQNDSFIRWYGIVTCLKYVNLLVFFIRQPGRRKLEFDVNLTSGWVHEFSINKNLWNLTPPVLPPNPMPLVVEEGDYACMTIRNQGN